MTEFERPVKRGSRKPFEETKRATNTWTRRSRNERFVRYWRAMTSRQLRRQRLVL